MGKGFDKKNKWETFARNNAEFYVDTNFMDYPEEERTEKFFVSGQDFTDQTLSRVDGILPDQQRALEVGAGVGRLALPHAQIFREMITVDIAPTMLRKLEKNAANANIKNVQTFLSEEQWDDYSISYVYSFLVFQHIEDITIIESYLKRIAGCLKKNGIAQLQFDTRPRTLFYRMRNSLPDFLLPKNQRKGIRRIRRNAQVLRNSIKKYHLEIKEEMYQNTAKHTFILKK